MSFTYFAKKLNYTLANEDTALELAILPPGQRHVVSVAGSGGRVLPLFARAPARLTAVDLSPWQLELTALRVEAARALSREEFLGFFGYPGGAAVSPEGRRKLLQALMLKDETRAFFTGLFDALGWESLLYVGRWEKTFKTISRVVNGIVGERVLEIFDCRTLAEQRAYLVDRFPDRRWKMALFALGNSALFNALLYKGHFPANNVARSYYRFYEEAFNRIFAKSLARENFFLQILLLGSLRYPEGNPVECHAGTYEAVQAGIRGADVAYAPGNVVEWVKSASDPVDFLSFSDVPSYFSDHLAASFMQEIAPRMAPGSTTVVRSYMHRPPNVRLDGYRVASEDHAAAIDGEKTQMYFVDVYERSPS
jgi:S-adenosylmethionine-diacylglycerol 3-amino-3-carboxypropyl transferase